MRNSTLRVRHWWNAGRTDFRDYRGGVDGLGSVKSSDMNMNADAVKSDDTLSISNKDEPTPGEEIIDRPDSSIFQIISVRYLKT